MKCPKCGTNNRKGVKFCEECGNKLKVNAATESNGKRKGFLFGFGLSAGGILLACLLCGVLYWSLLIPVPLLQKNAVGSDFLRRVRIFQENIGWRKPNDVNPERLPEGGVLQTVGMKNGNIFLPDTCGPRIDLEVSDVSKVQIWDELGQFGSGPLIYSMPNRGESMVVGEFGYHVEWVVIDEGERKLNKDNQWYACTGWDQDQLTCTGPDWQKYDSAQMCIYYEGPVCQVPVQCFIFNGEDAFPAQNQQACAQEEVNFNIDHIAEMGENGMWWITTNDTQAYDNKYILKTTIEDGVKLE